MTQDPQQDSQGRQRKYTKLWLALSAVLIILALIIVPPLVSISRYQNRITQLVSTSLGRPVRLSSVELRMLPRPGFLITNLTVDEDPAYGVEPVLHANTVLAAIRFLPLWRGQLQISRISVDEASFNLVRTPAGRWNLDAVFHSAAKSGAQNGAAASLPYIEATSSRINIKRGTEKLPFSLLDADASLWRDSSGAWRVRLRGQPARTDVSLESADTGVLRLEATLRQGPSLKQMPLHVDLDWREAQLGQLSRLMLGSDEGWRGDMTGELHLDGTAESAQVKTRLRASGVHRAEFAPAEALDFDASCGFVYRSSDRSLDNLLCESPLGNGRARLTGSVQGLTHPQQLTLELDRIPAEAGLDMLRTLRNNLDPALQASGAVSGKMVYDAASAQPAPQPRTARKDSRHREPEALPTSLSGSFEVDGLKISANDLSKPIQIPKMIVEPAPALPGQPTALSTSVPLPAGGPAPLTIAARLGLSGFQIGVHGTAALPRLRELAHVAGIEEASTLGQIAGGPAALDLSVSGSWLPSGAIGQATDPSIPASERMTGTVSLHDVSWKSDFLANPVLLKTAMLHVENGGLRWDPLDFAYGPLKGTATLYLPPVCEAPQTCPPQFTVRFASLKAADIQSAILTAHPVTGTFLSTLLARLRPSSAPAWPQLDGTVQADTFDLGPFVLSNVSASLRVQATGAEVQFLDAGLLGGKLHAAATLASGDKPDYKLDATLTQLNPAQVGQLVAMRWTGGAFDATAHLQLSGNTGDELAASAKGSLHFDWTRGSVAAASPAPLVRFDRWAGDAIIEKGAIALRQNQIQRGSKKTGVQASATFGTPAKVTFVSPPENRVARMGP